MARIRTIKPEFFRHEGLQDLEEANPGCHVMLVFAALWGHCDKLGRFEWKPRTLKLDILPFLSFDIAETLAILEGAGMLTHYVSGGKEYGEVANFSKHQRITGTEATEPEKHPGPTAENTLESTRKHRGNSLETTENQSGNSLEIRKGREGKGKEVRSLRSLAQSNPPIPELKDENQIPHTDEESEGGGDSSKKLRTGSGIRRKVGWPFGDSPLPDDYRQFAVVRLPDLDHDAMWEQFRSYAQANGKTYLDWSAAWRTWVLNAPRFNRGLVSGNTPEGVMAKVRASQAQLKGSILSALGGRIDDQGQVEVGVAATQGNLLDGPENSVAEDSRLTTVVTGEVISAKAGNYDEVVLPWDDEEPF